MHFITIFLASFLWWNAVTSVTIISSDRAYNDLDNDDFSSEYLGTENFGVSQTMYVSEKVGKSHKFFFTVGERKEGNYVTNLFIIIISQVNHSRSIILNGFFRKFFHQ